MSANPLQTVDRVGALVDAAAAANAARAAAASAATAARWQAFAGWYDAAAVAAAAAETANLSKAAQDATVATMRAYVAHLTAVLRGQRSVPVPKIGTVIVRNGADPIAVASRPAGKYRWTYALTADREAALEAALQRAQQVIETDVMLAARDAQHAAMEDLGANRYRRVLRPELAKSGHSCGLCAVASQQVYRIGELMPMHANCNCLTVEVTSQDPGAVLNKQDLDKIYAAAGDSTHAHDLKRVQVQVNEHGEMGPVLTVKGQHFLGKRAADDRAPEKAKETLEALLTNLDTFMADKAGEDVIGYQQRQIARLRAAA